MTDERILKHIQYLTHKASDRGLRLQTIVLVKLLYLLDLYYARETGTTLTAWNWRFYNYGPYTYEAITALGEAQKRGFVQSDAVPSKFSEDDRTLFSCPELEAHTVRELDAMLPLRVQGSIDRIIRLYGTDTHRLLHHVYFETEPMHNVEVNETLSFKNVSWPAAPVEEAPLKKLSKSKVERARAALAKMNLPQQQSTQAIEPIYDEIYEEGIRYLEESDRPPLSHSGVASISSLLKKRTG